MPILQADERVRTHETMSLKKTSLIVAASLTVLLAAGTTADAKSGTTLKWDNSFGFHGLAYVHGNGDDIVATAPDGGFGFLALQSNRILWMRLDRNGRRVDSFANNGILSVSIARSSFSNGRMLSAEFDRTGGAVLMIEDFRKKPGPTFARVIRVTRTGRIDRKFGSNGSVWIKDGHTEYWSAEPLRDGSILLSGQNEDLESFTKKLKTSGAVDTRYGKRGTARATNCRGRFDRDNTGIYNVTSTRADGSYLGVKVCLSKPQVFVRVDARGGEHPLPMPIADPRGLYPDLGSFTSPDRRGRTTQLFERPDNNFEHVLARLTYSGKLDTKFGSDGYLSYKQAGLVDYEANYLETDLSGLRSGGAYVFQQGLNDRETKIRAAVSILSPDGKLVRRVPAHYVRNSLDSVESFTSSEQPDALFIYGSTRNGTGLKKLILR
jgi:hypothetical protein